MGGLFSGGGCCIMCLYMYVCKHGRGPRIKEGPVLIWSWVSDLCPLSHSWGMVFMLQSAAGKRREAWSPFRLWTQKSSLLKFKCLLDPTGKLQYLCSTYIQIPHTHGPNEPKLSKSENFNSWNLPYYKAQALPKVCCTIGIPLLD